MCVNVITWTAGRLWFSLLVLLLVTCSRKCRKRRRTCKADVPLWILMFYVHSLEVKLCQLLMSVTKWHA